MAGYGAEARPVKRCPECFTNMPVDTTSCPSCRQKVKTTVDRNGYAKKPVNWYAYGTCLAWWTGVVFYIWWAFFR